MTQLVDLMLALMMHEKSDEGLTSQDILIVRVAFAISSAAILSGYNGYYSFRLIQLLKPLRFKKKV